MSDLMAQEAFASRNYLLAVEMFERCLKQSSANLEVLFGYGDSLAKCGRIRESIDIFARCFALGNVPLEKLRHLVNAILEDIGGGSARRRILDTFGCPICEGTLFQPVSVACGHTACRSCLEIGKNCRVCGHKIESVGEVNVLVQRLVEKWWLREAEASRVRHEADLLMRQGHVGQALERYNLAVHLVPNSPLHLSNRANALLQLNRPQASLADADLAVRLRPDWGKGHYRRGLALSATGRHEEALFELCISISIDKNPQSVRHEFTRILHRAFSSNLRRPSNTLLRSPYNNVESTIRSKRNRHRMLFPMMNSNQRHRRTTTLNSSDCEDNSSGGEEEFTQTIKRRLLLTVAPQDSIKLHSTLDRVYQEVEKLRRIELRPAELLSPPFTGGTSSGELDCILCCRVLWKPVTTPCGHTYCWMCLDRCLDYSSACPLCVTSLADYLASSQKTVTEFVERALKTVAPKEYASRAASYRHELVQGLGLVDSEQIAVFVCTTAFPCVACPLFVYEPRYRLMVRRCVESGIRQFGIAACVNREATGAKRYAEYGTMLEIRDRVLMKDGCSILSTVGARRFRVLSGGERDGYDTAQVELLRDSPIQSDRLSYVVELHNKVRMKCKKWWQTVSHLHRCEIERVFGEMPDPEEDWERLPDGPSWAWWILAILPLRPQLHVGILGTTSLEKRLRAIEKTFDHMEQRQLVVAPAPSEETTNSSSICRNSQDSNDSANSVIQQS